MMDNTTLTIENLAASLGSYIDATVAFKEKFPDMDFEDIIEVIHPNLVNKIKQEFINSNYFPDKKSTNIMEFFK